MMWMLLNYKTVPVQAQTALTEEIDFLACFRKTGEAAVAGDIAIMNNDDDPL